MASLPPQKRQRAPSPTGTRAETVTRRPRLGQASKNVEASERSGLTSVEIERVAGSIPGMSKHFKVIEKIGEGTFSSVYKAVDLQHSRYTNAHWVSATNSLPFFCNADDADEDARDSYRKMRFVALKKIYATSSPARIINEMSILHELRGQHGVMPLITAFRHEDQVVMVMPYFEHCDFRVYMHAMSLDDIKCYLRSLFDALAHVHAHGIIHRDVKPSNFLYDVKKRKGVLVDFGLAQRGWETDGDADYSTATATTAAFTVPSPRKRSRATALQTDVASGRKTLGAATAQLNKSTDTPASHHAASQSPYGYNPRRPPGYFAKDPRPAYRAARAGTRGFRAPEVLFKVTHQTPALDVWSVGVILLCILSRQFPFFNSPDDQEAIMEIACLFGNQEMERIASRCSTQTMTATHVQIGDGAATFQQFRQRSCRG